jgi:hypothetical protein
MNHTLQLLDYIATQEEAAITYHASDMILAAHSDASYLSDNLTPAAVPVATSSSPPMPTFYLTMEPFSTSHISSNTLWHPQPKPN